MNKIYFTALIPASDIDTKVKRFRSKCQIVHPLPPIVPLKLFNNYIERKEFKVDLNSIEVIETGELMIDNGWLVESINWKKLPATLLSTPLPFGLTVPSILIGLSNSVPEKHSYESSRINNCYLGFYELTQWDIERPFYNIELELKWKIKKKRSEVTS